jgi:hypothetical protein
MIVSIKLLNCCLVTKWCYLIDFNSGIEHNLKENAFLSQNNLNFTDQFSSFTEKNFLLIFDYGTFVPIKVFSVQTILLNIC